MKYMGALMAVEDMKRSREFYEGLLGQAVENDFGACVGYVGGFSIMGRSLWREVLGAGDGDGKAEKGDTARDHELYFEAEDVDGVAGSLASAGMAFLHGVREQPWRQKVLRCYDPDGHILEIAETIPNLIRRLSAEGMDEAAIIGVTGLPEAMVRSLLGGCKAS